MESINHYVKDEIPELIKQRLLDDSKMIGSNVKKLSLLDSINLKVTKKFFRDIPTVKTKRELDQLIRELVKLKRHKFNYLKQLIKINSGKNHLGMISLEQRFTTMFQMRLQHLRIEPIFPNKLEVRLLSQIISRTILLAAKRQRVDFLNRLSSMIQSYLELKGVEKDIPDVTIENG